MMDFPNCQLLQKLSLKEAKLRAAERRNDEIIGVLKRGNDSTLKQKSPSEKFAELQRRRSDYTFKLPKLSRQNQQTSETFKNGWRVSESRLSERVNELSKRRSKMILIGNFHSRNNKSSKQSFQSKLGRQQSQNNLKRELMMKAKQIGDQFVHDFMNRKKPSNDCYRRPMTHKQTSKIGNESVGSCNEQCKKLIDDIGRTTKPQITGELWQATRSIVQ